ncbi:ketopantoate reductase family protein [Flavobacterium gawalongense]|uniref:2-dehydropantoate 2-reductase n=1 Tax=Flavobacterium gawalongense TaxID=2594432 RepID=A0A553BG85_9FLAO|nr:2-dehydropantoate 2-reductase [Flavobacterium gawalongense]TRW99887.1 2-dehydropantoate 2-reductase [Flavobacterium gawalongense]TRX04351.1 2-dehydropantoate 2-reductase [Flavobacterium gawalongense]TRX07261.1 2-dehydropantoate 2-reductase [Flavobacterium gawalongense]TRX08011.1 2-dehydropantoate 2-reductase [Flavobacterium gawalongense]TRX24264.1 2-dehydropantoate 2-reductase [Flavobacterium gawalongense]
MKTRIGILGLGGVGGYFGGLLAKAYTQSEAIEIVFIARGETQKAIVQNGLKIICSASSLSLGSDESEMIVFPNLVSNDPEEIGKLDYLICATKTYDIESSFLSIKNCITPKTIILPLYNGVDATERIEKLFPENTVLQGCVYIISMIVSPGVIRKIGPYEKLFFGSKTAPISKLNELQSIFEKAAIESYLVDTIEETVWEKFIFISALASATSYLNQNIGAILNNAANKAIYISLLNEITSVAFAKGLALPNDIVVQTIVKLEKSPQDATSSMHRDLLAGRNTEVVSLTKYVVDQAVKFGVATPTYQMILEKLTRD